MIDMSFDKAHWRKRNWSFMQPHCEWTHDKKLVHPYVELFGISGIEMYRMMEKHLPYDETGWTDGFVAVEYDPEIVMRTVMQHAPLKFMLIYGDAFEDILRLQQQGKKFGTVNCDTTNGINQNWWDQHRDPIRDMVELGTQSCRRFVLILNHTLDRGADKQHSVADRIRMHAGNLIDTLKKWRLRESDLLRGCEIAEEKGFTTDDTGRFAGGFDIYRSKDKALRMITVRLAFDSRERCTIVDRADVRAPRR